MWSSVPEAHSGEQELSRLCDAKVSGLIQDLTRSFTAKWVYDVYWGMVHRATGEASTPESEPDSDVETCHGRRRKIGFIVDEEEPSRTWDLGEFPEISRGEPALKRQKLSCTGFELPDTTTAILQILDDVREHLDSIVASRRQAGRVAAPIVAAERVQRIVMQSIGREHERQFKSPASPDEVHEIIDDDDFKPPDIDVSDVRLSDFSNPEMRERLIQKLFSILECPVCMRQLILSPRLRDVAPADEEVSFVKDEHDTRELRVTICGHVFCKECMETTFATMKKCPICKHPLADHRDFHPLYL
ncbi:MAG: uncharacterized protein KVP18_003083 [Porospora cf. gigantea A]|uniref:uncharacterized protein n=1 Tax=Porospora cf. gigantea A TaxID=2853593 RepID=UPI003559D9E9|nr:MAG: hypothetical protein KVP18_003083 [Porospora cf. gigantea A]